MSVRCELRLDTMGSCRKLVNALCDGKSDYYVVESESGRESVNARSILGLLYASAEFDKVYLVNTVTDGYFPPEVNELRA